MLTPADQHPISTRSAITGANMIPTIASRLDAVRHDMAQDNLDAFIIPRADEYLGEYVPERNERLQWISHFTGSAGMVIVLKIAQQFLSMAVTPCKSDNR